MPSDETPRGGNSRRLDITSARILNVAKWDWTPVEDLMPELMGTVPSGQALRYYTDRSDSKGVKVISEDEKIASGKRGIVNARLNGLNNVRIELGTPNGVRSVRLRERRAMVPDENGGCPTCHRPFQKAAEQDPAPSVPQPKRVLYPSFPAWEAEWTRKTTGS